MPQRSKLLYLFIILVLEKGIQHIVVTGSFVYNIGNIRSTVAINYQLLMVSGAIIAVLFLIALWKILRSDTWGFHLVGILAIFDIIGEFIAQGTLFITITVSLVVAIILLVMYLRIRKITDITLSPSE